MITFVYIVVLSVICRNTRCLATEVVADEINVSLTAARGSSEVHRNELASSCSPPVCSSGGLKYSVFSQAWMSFDFGGSQAERIFVSQ